VLHLDDNPLSDVSALALATLTNLTVLNLDDNQLSDVSAQT
jgi:Leucine-rich repeat (LRR) protein